MGIMSINNMDYIGVSIENKTISTVEEVRQLLDKEHDIVVIKDVILENDEVCFELISVLEQLSTLKSLQLYSIDTTHCIKGFYRAIDLNKCRDLAYLVIHGTNIRYIPKINRCEKMHHISINVNFEARLLSEKKERTTYQLSRLDEEDWSLLRKVTSIELSGNNMEGTIPDWLGNMTELFKLSMCRNRLSGEIPETIRQLTSLCELVLERNEISGGLKHIRGLQYLGRMALNNNRITGKIPSTLLRCGSKSGHSGHIALHGNNFDEQVLPSRLRGGIRLSVDSNITVPEAEKDKWFITVRDDGAVALTKI